MQESVSQERDDRRRRGAGGAIALLWAFLFVHAGLLETASLHPLDAVDIWRKSEQAGLVGGGLLLATFALATLFRATAQGSGPRRRALFGVVFVTVMIHAFTFRPFVLRLHPRLIHSIFLERLSSSWHGVPVHALLLLAMTALFLVELVLATRDHAPFLGRKSPIVLAVVTFALLLDVVTNATTGAPLFGHRSDDGVRGGAPPCP